MGIASICLSLMMLLSNTAAGLDKKSGSKSMQSVTCPSFDNYTFYPLQSANGIFLDRLDGYHDMPDLDMNSIALKLFESCDLIDMDAPTAKKCNAFTTMGDLMVVPNNPKLEKMDMSDVTMYPCDGIYLHDARNAHGFKYQEDDTPTTIDARGKEAQKRIDVLLKAKESILRGSKQVPRSDGTNYDSRDMQIALTSPEVNAYKANSSISYPYISAVRNQGSCGSCVAFSAIATAEAAIAYATRQVINTQNMAEQWLFFCNGMYTPSCATGWWPSDAANVVVTKSSPYESCYPYTGAPSCTNYCMPNPLFANGTFEVTTFTSSQIQLAKDFIASGGAIMSFFNVYNDFYYVNRTSGIYRYDGISAFAGGHAVSVIGYSDTERFWLIKNSWGSSWGEYGYARIAYGQVGLMSGSSGNIIGLSYRPKNVTLLPPSPTPNPPQSFVCGNAMCDLGESCVNCAQDCGMCDTCGNGLCSATETCSTCPRDCGSCCGNGSCSAEESCANCPQDCGTCPTCILDKRCSSGETCLSCSKDCGSCTSAQGYCGDGICQFGTRKGQWTEYTSNCQRDCGPDSTGTYCGDGKCNGLETPIKCSRDCKLASGMLPGWVFPGLGKGTKDAIRKCTKGRDCPPSSVIQAPPIPLPSKKKPPPRKNKSPPPIIKNH